jgi:hypothetical protein
MAINLKHLIGLIPSPEVRETWPFKILDKNSASTSLLIITKNIKPDANQVCPVKIYGGNIPVAIKTWCKPRRGRKAQDEEKALEYEKKVYTTYIKNIINSDPNAPFLRYLGDDNNCTNVKTLSEFIGAIDDGAYACLCLAFYVMDLLVIEPDYYDTLEEKDIKINFMSRTFYTEFFFNLFPSEADKFIFLSDNYIPSWDIGAILLPAIQFKIFKDIIGTNVQVDVFKQVVQGLYTINKMKLVHNDLHPGNIMVEEKTNKALIYDWDRAYAKGLGDNKLLNKDPCDELCSSSQCNIFMEGRPIDLLKILCYTTKNINNFNQLLFEGLNLENFQIGNKTRFETIFEGIEKCGDNKCFYTFQSCSSLYMENQCAELETAIIALGSNWSHIFGRAFTPETKISEENVNDSKELQQFAITVLGSRLIDSHFGMTSVLSSSTINHEYNHHDRPFEKYKNKTKKYNLKIDDKMIRYNLSGEMRTELERLVKIKPAMLTWRDLVNLENITDYIKYGPPVRVDKPDLVSVDLVPTMPFINIMHKNESRKLYVK